MNKVLYHAKEAGIFVGGLVAIVLWFLTMVFLIYLATRLIAWLLYPFVP